MSLTDDWKKGELPSKDKDHVWLSYYIKHKDGLIHSDSYWRGKWGIADRHSIDEVLEPVPSYKEWIMTKALAENGQSAIDTNQRLAKVIEQLKSENAELKHFDGKNVCAENEILKVKVENLRDLLRECKPFVKKDFEYIRVKGWDKTGYFNEIYDLLARINDAIGESEE